ncbi:hypothetical protein PUN28_011835 [Cardiocondyla obscurior]|uniref:Uncharacterized protein n=1 Tax=Cardiocondyla obscurior TaxID=286306 RepID=A0AAW2FFP1_9HYME
MPKHKSRKKDFLRQRHRYSSDYSLDYRRSRDRSARSRRPPSMSPDKENATERSSDLRHSPDGSTCARNLQQTRNLIADLRYNRFEVMPLTPSPANSGRASPKWRSSELVTDAQTVAYDRGVEPDTSTCRDSGHNRLCHSVINFFSEPSVLSGELVNAPLETEIPVIDVVNVSPDIQEIDASSEAAVLASKLFEGDKQAPTLSN